MTPRAKFLELITNSGADKNVQDVCISAFNAGYSLGMQEGIRLSSEITKTVNDLFTGGKGEDKKTT